jgi:hypothetical protein
MGQDKTDKTDKSPDAKTVTPAVTEWGIPDWRDAAAYGDVKQWGFMRWRWEFSRRRDDLRAAFGGRAQETYEHYLKLHENPLYGPGRTLRPDEPGFTAQLFHDEAQKFGYVGLPNPRISEQPSHVIFSTLDYPGNNRMMIGKGARYPGKPEHEIDVGDGEMAVIFDLDKPLGPQLERLKKELTQRQISRHGVALQRRRHPVKWLGYLRTLDAREDGASWAEIAALHPNTAQTEQTARDIWDAANALRFNF